jgi:hypothetical protein
MVPLQAHIFCHRCGDQKNLPGIAKKKTAGIFDEYILKYPVLFVQRILSDRREYASLGQ